MNKLTAFALCTGAAAAVLATAAPANAGEYGDYAHICEFNKGSAAQVVNRVGAPQGRYVTNMGQALGDARTWNDTYWNGYRKIVGCIVPMTTNHGRAFLRYNVEVDNNGQYWVGTAGFTPSWSFSFD